jgi:hypothetical protein
MTKAELAEDIAEDIEAACSHSMEGARQKVRLFEAAVLRELAAELDDPREYLHSLAVSDEGVHANRERIAQHLRFRADALEAGQTAKPTREP